MNEILIISISLGALNFLLALSVCLLYYMNRSRQPFKSKTPFLVILSSFFSIVISVCYVIEKEFNLIPKDFLYEISIFETASLSFVFIPLLIRSWLIIEICYVNSFHLENPVEGSRMPKLVNKKLNFLICIIFCIFFLLLFMICFIPKESTKYYLNYYTFLYLIYSVEELMIIISLIILKEKDIQINMKFELGLILSIFFLMDLILLIKEEILNKNQNDEILLIIFFYLKMFIILLSFVLSPLLMKVKMIPYGEGPQCAQTIEKLLSSRIASFEFHNYLELNNDIEGQIMLEIYERIKLYELEFNKEEETLKQKTEDCAKTLINSYINTKSIFPKEIRDSLNSKFINREITKNLFDQVYGIVINQLQRIYSAFIYTDEFKNMEIKLRKNEIIFERLHKSNLI